MQYVRHQHTQVATPKLEAAEIKIKRRPNQSKNDPSLTNSQDRSPEYHHLKQ